MKEAFLEIKDLKKSYGTGEARQDVNHQLFTDSVEAEVLLSMKDKDEDRCLEILDSLGLKSYKDTHPMALSGGAKAKGCYSLCHSS